MRSTTLEALFRAIEFVVWAKKDSRRFEHTTRLRCLCLKPVMPSQKGFSSWSLSKDFVANHQIDLKR